MSLGAALDPSEVAILAEALAELQLLDVVGLRKRWRSLIGGPLPSDLGRPLTVRILAYKLQAQRLGDLDRVSLREFASVFNSLKKAAPLSAADHSSISIAEGCEKTNARTTASALPRIARPGTQLVREYGGVLQRVMVLDQGITWNGKTYDSLSQVALAITGTRWNGPRFFGLRTLKKGDGNGSQGELLVTAGLNAVASRQTRRTSIEPRATSPGIAP